MAGIKNNLSIDFLFNNLRSNISTKQLNSIKCALYLVDDILNIKYCSHMIANKKSILSNIFQTFSQLMIFPLNYTFVIFLRDRILYKYV